MADDHGHRLTQHLSRIPAPTAPARKLARALIAAAAMTCVAAGSAAAYGLRRQHVQTYAAVEEATGGDVDEGRRAMRWFGCAGCHTIPGVPGADGAVGPPLDGIAGRQYLAGRLSNDPRTMIRWIRNPPRLVPGTAMPVTGVTEQNARDLAAYLYTLK